MRYLVMGFLIALLICSVIFVYVTSTIDQQCVKMYPHGNSFQMEECTLLLEKQTNEDKYNK